MQVGTECLQHYRDVITVCAFSGSEVWNLHLYLILIKNKPLVFLVKFITRIADRSHHFTCFSVFSP